MAQLDIANYLSHHKGKPVNHLWYKIMRAFVAGPQAKAMNLEVVDNVGVKNIKGPCVVLSNHTSRCDWEYVGTAMYPLPLNFMASDVEFHRAHMHLIFKLCRVIPKKNFVSDVHCIREVLSIIKAGGSVLFFPEGKSSISGTNQPIMLGTSELLKSLKVPVYTTTIRGGYMSNTQWNIKNRPGKVVVYVNKLFDPEDMEKLSVAEMDAKINDAIYNDDFQWNKEMRVKFAGNEDIAVKLEEHLYWCPKCGRELTNKGEGNVIRCTACGNGAMINEYDDLVPLSPDCLIPKDLRVWFELQRRREYRAIRSDPDYMIEEKVTLGMQPNDHYVDKTVTSEPVGEGIVRLTRDEFSYVGTKNGEPFELHQKTQSMATVVMETDSSYFGAFFGGVYYEFKPEHAITTKWQIAVEEAHRAAGGRWQNTLSHQQWIYEDDQPTDLENYYQPTTAPAADLI
ncbi:MAG: 1-acyl-sn-glycerol-3-phosphate acyltransferase [Clostridia bacterium]|nr:1-acyl-sn-glycerol-3-phosphate acyltransferase [Clostridia bacterium]